MVDTNTSSSSSPPTIGLHPKESHLKYQRVSQDWIKAPIMTSFKASLYSFVLLILLHIINAEISPLARKESPLSTFKKGASLNRTRSSSYNDKCPEGCSCFYVQFDEAPGNKAIWVNCEEMTSKMTFLPPATVLPDEIWALDVTLNLITRLDTMDTLPTLRWFKISGNSLTRIEPNAFDNVASLEDLDLSFNNISELPNDIFSKLTNLKVLRLDHNHLQHLSEVIFDNSRELEELDLSYNPLKILYQEWFTSLQNLRALNVAHTGLMTIDHDTFHFTSSLEELDLSENNFSLVPNAGLKIIPNLKRLKLNGNPIKYINDESFEMLHSLQELEVCQSPRLTEIQAKSFSDLKNLRILIIGENPELVHIDSWAFYGITNFTVTSDSRNRIKPGALNLRHISLAGNRLQTLSQFSLPWCSLEFLDLRRNPWSCNCSLSWIHDCFPIHGDPR